MNKMSLTFLELLKLLDFLQFPYDPKRLQCTLKYKEGKFKRKKPKSKIVFPFTKDEVTENLY